MVRSNGILSGALVAYDALTASLDIVQGHASFARISRLAVIVLAGSFIAVGAAIPQFVAYSEYCLNDSPRPWCGNMIPSVYTFVQDHYW